MAANVSVAVAVDSVVKRFGAVRALDRLNLQVPSGMVYGLLGPNGAGKTTLIRLLATLGRPDAGRIKVARVDVAADPATVRERIRLAGQFAVVDDLLTGRENVVMAARLCGLPARRARRRAHEVLEQLGLGEVANQRAGAYSGGMRRRLDLAACLASPPEVLLLDEPTTGLDPASRLALWHQVHELISQGTTVVLATQQLDEAERLAIRLGVLDHGRLVCEGTPSQLKARLGGDRFEITPVPGQTAQIVAALERLPGSPPVVDETTGRVRMPAPHGHQSLAAALRALDAAGIEPADIALRTPTLDEVFIALTGHTAGQHPPVARGDHESRS